MDVYVGNGAHTTRTADAFPLYVGSDERAMWYYGHHVNGTGYAGAMYDGRALATTQYTVTDVDQCAALCTTGVYASWCVSFDYQVQCHYTMPRTTYLRIFNLALVPLPSRHKPSIAP